MEFRRYPASILTPEFRVLNSSHNKNRLFYLCASVAKPFPRSSARIRGLLGSHMGWGSHMGLLLQVFRSPFLQCGGKAGSSGCVRKLQWVGKKGSSSPFQPSSGSPVPLQWFSCSTPVQLLSKSSPTPVNLQSAGLEQPRGWYGAGLGLV